MNFVFYKYSINDIHERIMNITKIFARKPIFPYHSNHF